MQLIISIVHFIAATISARVTTATVP